MIECRPIREAEAPAYLRTLCRIFDLDYARAESVFYHEPFYDLDRKWALFDDGLIRSILTTVPLLFGELRACGIAGVGTVLEHRGRGYGQRLLEAALAQSAANGETGSLLFAQSATLYERCGFSVLDHVVRARFKWPEVDWNADLLTYEEVRQIYDAWSTRHSMRLIRDERRWNFWKWNLRICSATSNGYLCQEGDTVRECIWTEAPAGWPMFDDVEWYGLRSMGSALGLPLEDGVDELMLMGRGFTEVPQMFMTDQF